MQIFANHFFLFLSKSSILWHECAGVHQLLSFIGLLARSDEALANDRISTGFPELCIQNSVYATHSIHIINGFAFGTR